MDLVPINQITLSKLSVSTSLALSPRWNISQYISLKWHRYQMFMLYHNLPRGTIWSNLKATSLPPWSLNLDHSFLNLFTTVSPIRTL